jgi:hypothetical protein
MNVLLGLATFDAFAANQGHEFNYQHPYTVSPKVNTSKEPVMVEAPPETPESSNVFQSA